MAYYPVFDGIWLLIFWVGLKLVLFVNAGFCLEDDPSASLFVWSLYRHYFGHFRSSSIPCIKIWGSSVTLLAGLLQTLTQGFVV